MRPPKIGAMRRRVLRNPHKLWLTQEHPESAANSDHGRRVYREPALILLRLRNPQLKEVDAAVCVSNRRKANPRKRIIRIDLFDVVPESGPTVDQIIGRRVPAICELPIESIAWAQFVT